MDLNYARTLALVLVGLGGVAGAIGVFRGLEAAIGVAALCFLGATLVLERAVAAAARRAEEVARLAEQLAAGELHVYMPHRGGPAGARLAVAVNSLAERLRNRRLDEAADRVVDQAMVRESPNGLVVVDASGKIRSHNPALGALLPVRADAVGRRPIEVIPVPELQQVLDETARTRQPSEATATVGARDLLVRAAALADGKACMGIVLDITSVRAAERSRRDFVANVSHELRTPITALVGYAESLLDERENLPADVVRALEAIDRNARRLHLLTDDVLQLSRIEARSGALPLTREAIGPLVAIVVDRYRPRAAASDVAVEVQVEAGLTASVNADAFEHALGNLVDNAVKYTRRGGRVQVTAARAGDRVRVDVVDTGVGIDPVHHTRIFERFYRGDPARSREIPGTGLGLALVKHLCIAMTADVGFHSEPGVGSTFWLLLPA